MSVNPNRLSRFWNELKRRRVIHVIVVYATAAFALIDLVSNVTEPLHLPEWTLTLVIILFLVGFPVAIIFSWIFDVTPGGLEKTKPAEKLQEDEIPKTPNSWRIATFVSIVVIAGLVALNIFARSKGKALSKEGFDNSIAVLLFNYNSLNAENENVIDGYRAMIHNNLCHIKDLRVLALSAADKYSDGQKSDAEIAGELHVSYLLTGNLLEYGDQLRLIVQLMDKNDNMAWSESYDRQINAVEDHINIQSDIAQQVAQKIGAVITPDEINLIEKPPTEILPAYDLTLRAQKYFNQYSLTGERKYLVSIREVSNRALNLDPNYAVAYYWLGKSALSDRNPSGYWRAFYEDTALYFFNKALELDPDLADAYAERGMYYFEKYQKEKAIEDQNRSIELSPNNPTAYSNSGTIYLFSRDFIHAWISLKKAESLITSEERWLDVYRYLAVIYGSAGDSLGIVSIRRKTEQIRPEFAKGLEMTALEYTGKYAELLQRAEEFIMLYPDLERGYRIKAYALIGLGKKQEAEECIQIKLQLAGTDLNDAQRVGYILWENGEYEEARKYFNLQIDNSMKSLQKSDPYGQSTAAYDLAGVYAFLGRKDEAMKWLRQYEADGFISGLHLYIKNDPLFDPLRNDEEFQEIVSKANQRADELKAELREAAKAEKTPYP